MAKPSVDIHIQQDIDFATLLVLKSPNLYTAFPSLEIMFRWLVGHERKVSASPKLKIHGEREKTQFSQLIFMTDSFYGSRPKEQVESGPPR